MLCNAFYCEIMCSSPAINHRFKMAEGGGAEVAVTRRAKGQNPMPINLKHAPYLIKDGDVFGVVVSGNHFKMHNPGLPNELFKGINDSYHFVDLFCYNSALLFKRREEKKNQFRYYN